MVYGAAVDTGIADCLENTRWMQFTHRTTPSAWKINDPCGLRFGQKAPYGQGSVALVLNRVGAEDGCRILQMTVNESSEIGEGNLSVHFERRVSQQRCEWE